MDLLKYCPRCGKIEFYFKENECPFCGFDMIETKYTFGNYLDDSSNIEKQIKECINKSPEFDEELFKKRKAKENKEIHRPSSTIEQRALQNMGAIPKPIQCPYCNSTNVSKISTAGRVLSVGLFGLASKKVGKQWHCKKCGSDF